MIWVIYPLQTTAEDFFLSSLGLSLCGIMAGTRILVSVINDLATDQRVSRTCHELHAMGYNVLLIGRRLPQSLPMPSVPYAFHRMKLWFTRGAFFYAWYNWRLFWFLLFSKAQVLWSNDLDTLLANYLVSRIKRIPLVFDSHEYFTGVPELEHNAFARNVWKKIEKNIVPRLSYCITVNSSIADLFQQEYGTSFHVIRNVPIQNNNQLTTTRADLGMPDHKKIIILQGSGINMHRGGEELVEAFSILPSDYHLYIVGGGDVIETLQQMTVTLGIQNKVTFVEKQPYSRLVQFTMNADAGVTLDKDTNINYRLSLPNKIFDYLQCGIPVISSNLVELRRIVEQYKVGVITPAVTAPDIAQTIQSFIEDTHTYTQCKNNTLAASAELNWDCEKKVLHRLMDEVKKKSGY